MRSGRNEPRTSDLPSELASPAWRALTQAGYWHLKQIAEAGETEIARLHGVGPRALSQLRRALADRGLEFADPREAKG
jgi:hypothetical protein